MTPLVIFAGIIAALACVALGVALYWFHEWRVRAELNGAERDEYREENEGLRTDFGSRVNGPWCTDKGLCSKMYAPVAPCMGAADSHPDLCDDCAALAQIQFTGNVAS